MNINNASRSFSWQLTLHIFLVAKKPENDKINSMDYLIQNMEQIGATDIDTKRLMLSLDFLVSQESREITLDIQKGTVTLGKRI